ADDTIPQVGFLDRAMEAMKTLPDGWGLVGLNDGKSNGNKLAQHWLADKKLLSLLGGTFFSPEYYHCYCDQELLVKCKRMGRYIFADEARYVHDHPCFKDGKLTGDYQRVYSAEWLAHDKELFDKRVGWGDIAIGTRLTRIDPAFFWSWTGLLLGGRRQSDVILNPAVDLPHSCACNVLAHGFLKTKCDSLLLVDDDMEFIPTALERLRDSGQDQDILSGLFCCKRWPHRPCVLASVENDRPVSISSDSISPGILPVLYIGFGFTLIRRWIVEQMLKDKGEIVFEFQKDKGEDGLFSEQARAIGARLAVNTEVEIGHRMAKTIYFSARTHQTIVGDNTFGLDLK
ncbi:MAG: hypothetical protein LLG04_10900, partial [Parachlamydia sp.]|nr:hypothetical protein [Parachlamydia sp.]